VVDMQPAASHEVVLGVVKSGGAFSAD
jgi:hypothetical protein